MSYICNVFCYKTWLHHLPQIYSFLKYVRWWKKIATQYQEEKLYLFIFSGTKLIISDDEFKRADSLFMYLIIVCLVLSFWSTIPWLPVQLPSKTNIFHVENTYYSWYFLYYIIQINAIAISVLYTDWQDTYASTHVYK